MLLKKNVTTGILKVKNDTIDGCKLEVYRNPIKNLFGKLKPQENTEILKLSLSFCGWFKDILLVDSPDRR